MIGRAEDIEIAVRDPTASRRHAQIDVERGVPVLVDLGSRNGTRLNGELVLTATRLVSGDIIEIGNTTIVPRLGVRQAPDPSIAGTDEFLLRFDQELARARRHRRPLSIVMAVYGTRPALRSDLCVGTFLLTGELVGDVGQTTRVWVLPEVRRPAATLRAKELRSMLVAATADVDVAIACYPADGSDAGSLLSVARGALSGIDDHIRVGDLDVVAADPTTARTYELLRRLAASDLAVLLAGETGAGKEMAALALHTWSPRAEGPFVPVNCAALPENLIESELFGHEKGAFSGADTAKAGIVEQAAGGTLFLDEVGEMPAAAQAKLLRVLQDKAVQRVGSTKLRPVDFRLVAATNRDVLGEVEAGRFREDLYYRLAAAVVELPPLRDRPRDIAVLARDALASACSTLGREPMQISDAAMGVLCGYRFPGNIRELINAMEFAAATNPDTVIDPSHLPASMGRSRPADPGRSAGSFRPLAEEVAELEARRIAEALEAAGGNQKAAAELIGMPRRTFVTKLGRYNLR